MTERDDSFVSRWSKRKRDDRTGQDGEAPSSDAATAEPEPGQPTETEEGDPEVVANLPDIDSLDETSDFTPFMAQGVPEILRRRALRKLWRLNPLLANLDGLNDYDEDFTDAAALVTSIKTVYKVGRGMVEKEPAKETGPEPAQAEGEAPREEISEASESGEYQTGEDETSVGELEEETEANIAESPAPVAPADDNRKSRAEPLRTAAARRWGKSSG